MNTMMHNGYAARIEYSEDGRCFIGRVAGIHDVIEFRGTCVKGLRAAFEKAVDDYLAACGKLNRQPGRLHSGQLRLRLSPGLHAQAAMIAEAQGKSLNSWICEAVEKAVASD